MKYLAALALVTAVLATPAPTGADSCKPATYECAKNPKTGAEGWHVCNVMGKWEYGGDCPPKTHCEFYPVNGSPYCIPN